MKDSCADSCAELDKAEQWIPVVYDVQNVIILTVLIQGSIRNVHSMYLELAVFIFLFIAFEKTYGTYHCKKLFVALPKLYKERDKKFKLALLK